MSFSLWNPRVSLYDCSQVGNEIHIGAMTTEHELLHSKLLADKVPIK